MRTPASAALSGPLPARTPRLRQDHVVAALFVVGMFVSVLDSTIVNTALPAIARQFHRTAAAADWTVIGYLLSLSVFMPASGWLSDRFGSRRVFLSALFLFTLASALCGLATSMGELVAFRLVQGVGGGMLTPVGQAMLFRAFPPARRARASAILMIPTVIAPALGPVLGGLLVDTLSWRYVFYANLPVGLVALAFGLRYLEEHRVEGTGGFDVAGFALAGLGLGGMLYALSEGPVLGLASAPVVGAGLGGLLAIVLFVRTELRSSHPMLDLRLLNDRLFSATNAASLWGRTAFGGVLFLLPQFLQEARHASALSSGLTVFPEALGVMLSTQLVARIYPRVGPRRLMAGGLAGVAVVMALLAMVGLGTSEWWIRALLFATGVGMACQIMPLQAASMARIESSRMARASAIFNTQRQVALALGTAILGTIESLWLAGSHLSAAVGPGQGARMVPAFHAAFWAAAAIALGSAVTSWLLVRDADALSTMVRREPPAAAAAGPALPAP